jgi:hypothetical protein
MKRTAIFSNECFSRSFTFSQNSPELRHATNQGFPYFHFSNHMSTLGPHGPTINIRSYRASQRVDIAARRPYWLCGHHCLHYTTPMLQLNAAPMRTLSSTVPQWFLIGFSVFLISIIARVFASHIGLRRRKMGCGNLIDDETGRYICGGRWVVRVKLPSEEGVTREKCVACKNVRVKKNKTTSENPNGASL